MLRLEIVFMGANGGLESFEKVKKVVLMRDIEYDEIKDETHGVDPMGMFGGERVCEEETSHQCKGSQAWPSLE